MMLPLEYVSAIPEISLKRTRPIEDWRAGKIEHAAEIAHELLGRFEFRMDREVIRGRMGARLSRRM